MEEMTTFTYFLISLLCIMKYEITEMNMYFKRSSFGPSCPEPCGEDTSHVLRHYAIYSQKALLRCLDSQVHFLQFQKGDVNMFRSLPSTQLKLLLPYFNWPIVRKY